MNEIFLVRSTALLPRLFCGGEADADSLRRAVEEHGRVMRAAIADGDAVAFGKDFDLVVVLAALGGFQLPGLYAASFAEGGDGYWMEADDAARFGAALRTAIAGVPAEVSFTRRDVRSADLPPDAVSERSVLMALAMVCDPYDRRRVEAAAAFAEGGHFFIW